MGFFASVVVVVFFVVLGKGAGDSWPFFFAAPAFAGAGAGAGVAGASVDESGALAAVFLAPAAAAAAAFFAGSAAVAAVAAAVLVAAAPLFFGAEGTREQKTDPTQGRETEDKVHCTVCVCVCVCEIDQQSHRSCSPLLKRRVFWCKRDTCSGGFFLCAWDFFFTSSFQDRRCKIQFRNKKSKNNALYFLFVVSISSVPTVAREKISKIRKKNLPTVVSPHTHTHTHMHSVPQTHTQTLWLHSEFVTFCFPPSRLPAPFFPKRVGLSLFCCSCTRRFGLCDLGRGIATLDQALHEHSLKHKHFPKVCHTLGERERERKIFWGERNLNSL